MKNTRNLWRVLSLVLVLTMLFAIVACTKEEPAVDSTTAGTTTPAATTTKKTTTTKQTTVTATTTAATTAKPVDPATIPIAWDAFTKDNFATDLPTQFCAADVIAINCADLETQIDTTLTTVTDKSSHWRYETPAGPVSGQAGAHGVHSIEVDGNRHYYIEPQDTAGDFTTPFIRWEFSVPADGWYDVCFYLRLKNGDFRTSMIQIDDEPINQQDYLHYEMTKEEATSVTNNSTNVGTYLTGYKVYLTKGDHTWTHRLSPLDTGKTAQSDGSGPSFHYRKIYLAMSPDQTAPGNQPVVATEVETLTVDKFSKDIPVDFTGADVIKIEGDSAKTEPVNVQEVEANKTYFLVLKDPTNVPEGASAHGVRQLVNQGVYHYYLDAGKISNLDGTAIDWKDCYIRWEFEVPAGKAGSYSLGFYNRQKNADSRSGYLTIDGKTYKICYDINGADLTTIRDVSDGSYLNMDSLTLNLTEGKHTITYQTLYDDADKQGASWHFRNIYVIRRGDATEEPPVEEPKASVYTGTPDVSWFDENDIKTEYTLTTADQFMGYIQIKSTTHKVDGTTVGKYPLTGVTFKLDCDVVINELTPAEMLAELAKTEGAIALKTVPQQNSAATFEGIFDGQNHTISGVYTAMTGGNRGLFGGLGDNAVIKNVNIEGALYTFNATSNKNRSGFAVGALNGENILIENVHVIGSVMTDATSAGKGFQRFAGLVGNAASGTATIKNCSVDNTSSITQKGEGSKTVGGLIGEIGAKATVTLVNTTSAVSLDALDFAGGLVGNLLGHLVCDSKSVYTGTITVPEGATKGDVYGNKDTAATINGAHVEVPTQKKESYSATKPEAFNDAIFIAGSSCETDAVNIKTANESKGQYHLALTDPTTVPVGASAHGVFRLKQGTKADGSNLYHYYVDVANVKNVDGTAIEKEDAYIRWTFTVTEAGKYNLGFYVRQKNPDARNGLIIIDDTVYRVGFDLTELNAGSNKWVEGSNILDSTTENATQGSYLTMNGMEFELAAGEHTITYKLDTYKGGASWHIRDLYIIKVAEPAA